MPLHISLSNPEKGSVRIFGRPKKRGVREVFQGLVWTLFRCLHTIWTETSQNIYHMHRSGRLTNSKLIMTKVLLAFYDFLGQRKFGNGVHSSHADVQYLRATTPTHFFNPVLSRLRLKNSSTQPLKYRKIDWNLPSAEIIDMEIQKMGRGSKFGACESPDQRGLLEEGTPNGNGVGVTSIKVPLPHPIYTSSFRDSSSPEFPFLSLFWSAPRKGTGRWKGTLPSKIQQTSFLHICIHSVLVTLFFQLPAYPFLFLVHIIVSSFFSEGLRKPSVLFS